MTDSELTALLETDPSEGLRVMIDDYSGLVYTVVYSKLGNIFSADDIEEFVSHIFGCVYEKRREIDFSRGSFKSYITTVAKRMCIDEYRKYQSRVKTVGMSDEQAALIKDTRNMQEDVERRLDEQALAEALGRLNEADRTVLVRRFYYNQTSAQIAKAMHTTDTAVRKRISRAMARLREMLPDVAAQH